MLRITLHRLITGSKFVQWLNGNIFDFRKENLIPIEKAICPRPCGIGRKHNPFSVINNAVVLDVNCSGEIKKVYIDCEDFLKVSHYLWGINPTTGYVQAKERLRAGANKGVYIHRIVMNDSEFHEKVDHINGDKLDNRKYNLRICDQSQNDHNSHMVRNGEDVGVYHLSFVRWNARIQIDSMPILKQFKTYDEAVAQRKEWDITYADYKTIRNIVSKNEFPIGISKVVIDYWEARIQVNNVGRSKKFKTREEAIAQRKQWELELNPSGLSK